VAWKDWQTVTLAAGDYSLQWGWASCKLSTVTSVVWALARTKGPHQNIMFSERTPRGPYVWWP